MKSNPTRATAHSRDEALDEVLGCLAKRRKTLPSKYFYDDRGSRLFEEICELDEYYPTRAEIAILEAQGDAIGRAIGPRAMVIEYGSGSSRKVRALLDDLIDPAAYVPVDISGEHLRRDAAALTRDYPSIEILPVEADYTLPFSLPRPRTPTARRVVWFAGSNIGNYAHARAVEILGALARTAGPGGGLLIGVDLRKDPAVLERAYDDARGVTAAFNLNILEHLNRAFGADFDLTKFRHRARWNDAQGRVEMHLESLAPQSVHLGGRTIALGAGETICTEYSYKYTVEGFAELAAEAGWRSLAVWTDPGRLFSVHWMERG